MALLQHFEEFDQSLFERGSRTQEKQMPSKISDENLTGVLRMMDYSDAEYERLLEAQEWPLSEAEKISELLQEECSAYCWYEVIALDSDLSDPAAVHDWVHDSGSVVVDRLPDDDETLVMAIAIRSGPSYTLWPTS